MPHPDVRLAVEVDGTPRLLQYFSLCGVWAVTPYTACDLRCSYCVTFSQGKSLPRLGKNIGAAVQHELERIPPDATLAVGGLVDAYPKVEDEFGITRSILRALAASGRQVVVITKGPTVVRDIDLLLEGEMRVCISISSLDDSALGRLEPYVATAAQRMQAIEALAEAGVDVCLQAQPWIPGFTDAKAMIDWADGRFPVSFTPLVVKSPGVARTPLGRQFTQQEINRAYLKEREKVGKRPLVQWHKPLWVGTTDVPAQTVTSVGLTYGERRNLAAVRHFLEAFKQHAQYEVLLGFISPYARLIDRTGYAADHMFPESGRAYDLLYSLYEALDSPQFSVQHLQASGDVVDLHLEVRGVHARPLFDFQPAGKFVRLPVKFSYVFDSQGLVLDYEQDADLNLLSIQRARAI